MLTTKWCIATGAPCSGKTTTLQALARELGCRWIPEAARLFIDAELAKGKTLEAVRSPEGVFQQGLVDYKHHAEAGLDPAELVLLDRAMPDSITYFRAAGLDPAPLFGLCREFCYAAVFLFERLPWEQDGRRSA